MVIFFAVSIALLYFVKHNSCRSYIEIWGGLLPVQVCPSFGSFTALLVSGILFHKYTTHSE